MEFAFVLPVLLFMLAGIVEFGRWFQAYDGVNRLATRYAAVYSDCNDSNPSGACKTELATYWPTAAVANVAPQLANGTVVVRMFMVQYATGATTPTVVYSYPSNATMSTAESQAVTTAVYNQGIQVYGVVSTVQYTYAPLVFPQLFAKMAPNANLAISYTIAQRKT